MNAVNRTLYIPLYGKAFVSRRQVILHDPKAEEIWEKEGFPLKGKARSKWLAYYMGMRSAVFDRWLRERMEGEKDCSVIHIGCGMDSRVQRVGTGGHPWYDVDFPQVIEERRKYFQETEDYHMVPSDIRTEGWLERLPEGKRAAVVMEGVSMYLEPEELTQLLAALAGRFSSLWVLMDCYTVFAAKASRYKNPVNEVGVTQLCGVSAPEQLENGTGLRFTRELELTPENMIRELQGFERWFFRLVFAGGAAKKLYRLFEYRTD